MADGQALSWYCVGLFLGFFVYLLVGAKTATRWPKDEPASENRWRDWI
jgi:hypothetical protein